MDNYSSEKSLGICLDSRLLLRFTFAFQLFFFYSRATVFRRQCIVHALFVHCSCIVHALFVHCSCIVCALFMHCSRVPRHYSHIKKLFCYSVFSFQFSISAKISCIQTGPKTTKYFTISCHNCDIT